MDRPDCRRQSRTLVRQEAAPHWWGKTPLVLQAIILLNALDATFSVAYISPGQAIEINPVWKFWLELSSVAFVTLKVLLVTACCVALHRTWHHTAARLAGNVLCLVYTALMCWWGYQIYFYS